MASKNKKKAADAAETVEMTEAVEAVETVEAVTAEEPPKIECFIYCGASIRGRIQNGTIISDVRENIDARYAALYEACPAVRELIVPVERAQFVRGNIASQRGIDFINYRKTFNIEK